MHLPDLTKRQFGYGYGYDNCDAYGNCSYSRWDSWGRWVLLAVVIVVVLIIFFLFSCITARRRRRAGAQPWRGTAWMAPQHGQVNYYGPGGSNAQTQQPQYYPSNNQSNDAAPPYNASNAGYYGQPTYEMQAPQNAYQPPGRGGEPVYAPPAGPPPAKQ